MISGIGRTSRSWISSLAVIAIAGFAMVIAGCDGETPTGPIEQVETARITRTAIDDTLGAVGGTVFNDMNQNGVRDAGEPGLEGLDVGLADPTGKTQGAKTDADGNYLFDDLEPAIYIVTAPVVEGWTATTPMTVAVKVNEAELATIDHGLYMEASTEFGSVGGTVFSDMNQNGTQDDGEMGLEGLTVGLIDPDGKTEGAKSHADGNFLFANLQPAVYKVVGPMVEGWVLTTADSVEVKVVVAMQADVDFGLYMDDLGGDMGSIAGTVFDDMNQNGLMDEGEMGLEGLTVGLVDPDGKSMGAKSDADGNYSFADLLSGDYTVVGPTAEGWMLTTPDSVQVKVIAEITAEVDFGLYMDDMGGDYGTIGGRIYEDLNHNGTWDEGEPGIAGVKVRLSSRNNPRNEDTKKGCGVHRYAMSGEDGTYVFEEVRPGSWRVKPSKPHGYHRSSAKDLCVMVMAGEVVDDANFGFVMKKDECDDDDDDDDDDD